MIHHSAYFGVNIYRRTTPGYQLRWSTVEHGLAADTLSGIRKLIREAVKGRLRHGSL